MPEQSLHPVYRSALKRTALTVLVLLAAAIALALWTHGAHTGRISISAGEATVLFAIVFLLMALAMAGAIALARLLHGWLRPAHALSRQGKRVASCFAVLAMLEVAGCLWGRYAEPFRVATREITLPLPGVLNPVRVAVLSDLHSDARFDLDSTVARQVNELGPDLILFLGDSLNHAQRAPAFRRALSAMNARAAKLAIRGNWDMWYWDDIDLFGGSGFDEIVSGWRTVTVGQTELRIGGHRWRDDFAPRAIVKAPPAGSGPAIFLYHANDYIPSAADRGIDLYLCGDTHGGQIELPGLGPVFAVGRQGLRFVRGLYDVARAGRSAPMKAYVTPGIGIERSLPFRLGVRPEITVLNLEPAGT